MASFDNVVEDMSIAQKLEVYQGLQQQVSTNTRLLTTPLILHPYASQSSFSCFYHLGLVADSDGGSDHEVA